MIVVVVVILFILATSLKLQILATLALIDLLIFMSVELLCWVVWMLVQYLVEGQSQCYAFLGMEVGNRFPEPFPCSHTVALRNVIVMIKSSREGEEKSLPEAEMAPKRELFM